LRLAGSASGSKFLLEPNFETNITHNQNG
jgi:hypothetical protein